MWGRRSIPLSSQTPFTLIIILFPFCLRQGFTVWPWLAWDSLCGPGHPETHRDPSAPTFSLGLKGCTTTLGSNLVFETDAHTKPEAHWSVSQADPGSYLRTPWPGLTQSCLLCTWVLRIWTWVFMIKSQVLYHLSCLFTPSKNCQSVKGLLSSQRFLKGVFRTCCSPSDNSDPLAMPGYPLPTSPNNPRYPLLVSLPTKGSGSNLCWPELSKELDPRPRSTRKPDSIFLLQRNQKQEAGRTGKDKNRMSWKEGT